MTLEEIIALVGPRAIIPSEGQLAQYRQIIGDEAVKRFLGGGGFSAFGVDIQRNYVRLLDFIIKPQLVTVPFLGSSNDRLVPGSVTYPVEFLKLNAYTSNTLGVDEPYNDFRDKHLALNTGSVFDIVNPRVLSVEKVQIDGNEEKRVTMLDFSDLIFAWHYCRASFHDDAMRRKDPTMSIPSSMLIKYLELAGLEKDVPMWLVYLGGANLISEVKLQAFYNNTRNLGLGWIETIGDALQFRNTEGERLEPFLDMKNEAVLAQYDVPSGAASVASGAYFGNPKKLTEAYDQVFFYADNQDTVITLSMITNDSPYWNKIKSQERRTFRSNMGTMYEQRNMNYELNKLVTQLGALAADEKVTLNYLLGEKEMTLDQSRVKELAATAAIVATVLEYRMREDGRSTSIIENHFREPPKRPITWDEAELNIDFADNTGGEFDGDKSMFIARVLPLARVCSSKFRVPVAIIMAIAAYESGWGKYSEGNNLCGIKDLNGSWARRGGATHNRADSDCNPTCKFRSYESWQACLLDLCSILTSKPWFSERTASIPCKNSEYLKWLEALKAGGYATYDGWVNAVSTVVTDNLFDRFADTDVGESMSVDDVLSDVEETEVEGAEKSPERSRKRKLLRE